MHDDDGEAIDIGEQLAAIDALAAEIDATQAQILAEPDGPGPGRRELLTLISNGTRADNEATRAIALLTREVSRLQGQLSKAIAMIGRLAEMQGIDRDDADWWKRDGGPDEDDPDEDA